MLKRSWILFEEAAWRACALTVQSATQINVEDACHWHATRRCVTLHEHEATIDLANVKFEARIGNRLSWSSDSRAWD